MIYKIMMYLRNCMIEIAVCIALVIFFINTEHLYFPVIRDWKVTELNQQTDGSIVIAGEFSKVRSCKLNLIDMRITDKVYNLPSYIKIIIDTEKKNYTYNPPKAHSGVLRWGPWKIDLPSPDLDYKQISFYAHYTCFRYWDTVMKIGTLELYANH